MSDRHELWELLDGLQMDLRAANGKLVTIRSHIAGMNLPEPSSVKCPTCGLQCKGPRTLAEHRHVSHGAPLPEHWAAADALTDDDDGKSVAGR